MCLIQANLSVVAVLPSVRPGPTAPAPPSTRHAVGTTGPVSLDEADMRFLRDGLRERLPRYDVAGEQLPSRLCALSSGGQCNDWSYLQSLLLLGLVGVALAAAFASWLLCFHRCRRRYQCCGGSEPSDGCCFTARCKVRCRCWFVGCCGRKWYGNDVACCPGPDRQRFFGYSRLQVLLAKVAVIPACLTCLLGKNTHDLLM